MLDLTGVRHHGRQILLVCVAVLHPAVESAGPEQHGAHVGEDTVHGAQEVAESGDWEIAAARWGSQDLGGSSEGNAAGSGGPCETR